MANYILLPQQGLIKVTGEEKFSFLQGLLSNDVEKLKKQPAVYAAMLSSKGKFLCDMILHLHDDAIYLETWQQTMPDLLKKLKMYKLRSKVELEDLSEQYQVAVSLDNTQSDKAEFSYQDPRNAALGTRLIFKNDAQEFTGNYNSFEEARISNTIPQAGSDLLVEKSFLLDHRFEALNGVDFDKGCYVGQEIVARMKYKAELRKQLYTIKANDGQSLEQGQELFTAEGKKVGEVRSVQGNIAIALLQNDAVDKLQVASIAN